MHMQIFHFTVHGMPTYEMEREYFLFVLKLKFPNNYLEQIKIKDKQHIPNSFFFFEINQKGKSLFS